MVAREKLDILEKLKIVPLPGFKPRTVQSLV
jgi:hypothetical protein